MGHGWNIKLISVILVLKYHSIFKLVRADKRATFIKRELFSSAFSMRRKTNQDWFHFHEMRFLWHSWFYYNHLSTSWCTYPGGRGSFIILTVSQPNDRTTCYILETKHFWCPLVIRYPYFNSISFDQAFWSFSNKIECALVKINNGSSNIFAVTA